MKKALALLLVLVLALGMSTVAFAAPGVKLDKKVDYADILATSVNDNGGDGVAEVSWDLVATAFATDGTPAGNAVMASASGLLSKETISKNDIGVKIKWSKGSAVLDEVKIDKDAGKIKVIFSDHIATIKDIDYEGKVYLTIGSKTFTNNDKIDLDFSGTYSPNEYADWDDDWFDFDGSNFVKPDTFIRNMEFCFSDDVSVWGRALKGVKYYGYATDDDNDKDTDIMIANPSIIGVYNLTQINVKAVADYVTLNDADASVFVYTVEDGAFKYLGKGNQKLDYADVYYLAASELDTEVEPEEEEEEEEEEIAEGDNVPGGGDDLYPSNPHDNPGTGK